MTEHTFDELIEEYAEKAVAEINRQLDEWVQENIIGDPDKRPMLRGLKDFLDD